MKVYTTTPADGETLAGEFPDDWFARRADATTDKAGASAKDSSSWQFQVITDEDWRTSQTFMLSIVAVTVGSERWAITKVEKPIGQSLIWKLKGKMQ